MQRPINRRMQLYMVNWTGPDGDHISAAHSKAIGGPNDRKFVEAAINRSMRPSTPDYPDGNPDIKITAITAVSDYGVIIAAAQKLREANPDRPLAPDLVKQGVVDTANRILHDPAILRNVAASSVPG